MTSEFFQTNTNLSSETIPRAISETHEFVYEPTDQRFPEASVFTHAHLSYDYFKTLGYSWVGNKPLILKSALHAT